MLDTCNGKRIPTDLQLATHSTEGRLRGGSVDTALGLALGTICPILSSVCTAPSIGSLSMAATRKVNISGQSFYIFLVLMRRNLIGLLKHATCIRTLKTYQKKN